MSELFVHLESEAPNTCFGVFRQELSSIFPPPGPERKHQWWSPGEDSCVQQNGCHKSHEPQRLCGSKEARAEDLKRQL